MTLAVFERKNHMPVITNSSVLNQAKRVCKVLKSRGENLSQENSATILVRALLEELGEVELLNSTEKIDIEQRAALIQLAKPFCTAAKNYQDSYLAGTNGDDGKPLLDKSKGTEAAVKLEFA